MTDKITIDRSLLQQALDAFKENTRHLPVDFDYHFEAMTAIRQALAAPATLTDQQIRHAMNSCDEGQEDAEYAVAFARAIEAAHSITGETK